MRRRSIIFFCGRKNLFANTGFERANTNLYHIQVTMTALSITKAKLGSQFPVTSKKFNILVGLIIFEMAKPHPKIIPQIKAVKSFLMIGSKHV